MSDLHPTKTRLALLQAVADGAVSQSYTMMPTPTPYYSTWDLGPGTGGNRFRKVTAAVADQERAGWIRLGNRWDNFHAPRLWEITDEGQRVLDAAGAS